MEICRKKFYGANVVFSVQIILDLKKKRADLSIKHFTILCHAPKTSACFKLHITPQKAVEGNDARFSVFNKNLSVLVVPENTFSC